MKKILVVQYSQTGQLSKIVDSLCRPLIASRDIEVVIETLRPEKPYPYPWSFFKFLDVFPECVALDPPALSPLTVGGSEEFDLIIIAYQVWFLAPSPPITAFMQSEQARRLLKDRPVITLIGCRNMWSRAQETMKQMLNDTGARLIDNVVLTDQGSWFASFVTTPRWLLSGKKEPFWGFPAAGVSDRDIENCHRFGLAIEEALKHDRERGAAPLLYGLKAVEADISQVQSEKAGHRSFLVWGRLLRLVGKQGDRKRLPVLAVYVVFLILMIITLVPLSVVLKSLLAPLLKERHLKAKTHYEAPSGSGAERMEVFGCGK
ncbi:MAG: dialkylresorcinol condensing enzyme [Candidatus Thiodiazotropha sp. (ex Epidulcina cf. delphinae)]|nr:dialkylresorcinol condensing enzyme [Candidatus Thiodiazotropha sp. (ex Epidulcina cf. delphinae)]